MSSVLSELAGLRVEGREIEQSGDGCCGWVRDWSLGRDGHRRGVP